MTLIYLIKLLKPKQNMGKKNEYLRYSTVLKLEGFSYLSCRSFGLDSPIGLEALSLVLSLRVST